ncbi:DUF262 domain-containing protein [Lentzea sp. BCCO 10_0798]|uniref:DUF262 domain-containing protein n=1 Tax=Lentzea kristufekii TaxID=3095430 RepID=A0ABU4U662_9PSEU|nr:DUF262 domain-containing protein [Lentzea sp. BCCO 10_0798]MDX8056062.1 DUF262 domain-containing protein [Lentzea sp. BCCO 10_0798]
MADIASTPDEHVIQALDNKITAVRTNSLDFSFNELADMHSTGELVIRPEFQRLFRWPEGAQSRFIESLLLELPVPPIFLIERDDRIYELIDGLQRISSFLHFRGQLEKDGELLEPLILSDCDIVPELNGYAHADLPRSLAIKLKRSYIRAEILRKESDPRLRYYMFKRLNTGGERLSEQEVRNATIRLLSNDFNLFIVELSENPDFTYLTSIISDNARNKKFDQELVLRFLALKNDFDSYQHDVADFLTDYMEKVSDPDILIDFDEQTERHVFTKTFKIFRLIADKLDTGPKIFGALGKAGEPRGQFSVYHYEGLTLGLQAVLDQIDPENPEHIDNLAAIVQSGKRDPDFLKHGGGGKNYRNPLRFRVEYFAERFKAVLA